uniref:Uncharacterized protein n=1 Tax=Caenorhabditis japonica TaxID=281687 RepID=A0A8R1ID10_CAEJA
MSRIELFDTFEMSATSLQWPSSLEQPAATCPSVRIYMPYSTRVSNCLDVSYRSAPLLLGKEGNEKG